jgi:predicted O-methyltransferase YrrM
VDERTWTEVDGYLAGLLAPEEPVLAQALADSAAAGLPDIAVSPVQGKFLNLLARLMRARRILEVGTLGGYSSIWLGTALPPDGRMTTLELEPRHAEVARANLSRAGLADRVEVRVGPALESLRALEAERADPYDLVFIDADKENNPAYVEAALRLTRRGAAILVDNVVRGGRVRHAHETQPSVVGTRRMFEMMAAEPRLDATAIQTVGAKGWDGLAIAMVVADP